MSEDARWSSSFVFQTLIHWSFLFLKTTKKGKKKKQAHPLSAATQLFSALDGSVGVEVYHSFLFFPLSLSLSVFATRTHIFYFSSTSSIITPPSIQDTAELWCYQPEPDALSYSYMRHLSGPPPPPYCSMSSTYTSVVRVTGAGLFCCVGGQKLLSVQRKTSLLVWKKNTF